MTHPNYSRRPNMHPVDVVIVICVTLVVLVGLYSVSGCGGADFRVMDGEEDDAKADGSTDSTAIDSGAPDLVEVGRVDAWNDLDVLPAESAVDSVASGDGSAPDVAAEAETLACKHDNGLGQAYTLCVPLGKTGDPASYSIDMAKRARDAWPTPGIDGEGACNDGTPLYVWRKTATACAAWTYTNGSGAWVGSAGHVYLGSTACSCPDKTCAAWN